MRRGCRQLCFEVQGVRFGLLICEDAWFDEPAQVAAQAGAQALLVLNASPFHLGKGGEREARMGERARAVGLPVLYAHLTGGQDEVVFDGASFALRADGSLAARAPSFEECTLMLSVSADGVAHGPTSPLPSQEAQGLGGRWLPVCVTMSERTAFRASSSA